MMVRITETGKLEKLELIDPRSGVNWVADLMGTHDSTPDIKDDEYIMSQSDFDWWDTLVTAYQAADNRYHGLLLTVDDSCREKLESAYRDVACDLEDYPAALNAVCDEVKA